MENTKIKNISNAYDEVLYTSKSFYSTQPYKMKSILQLYGFETHKISNSRVLEIGCSMGGNIIATAIAHPNAEFIGLDLSKNQIDKGNEIIEFLGIENIKLYHKNILDYNGEYGKFDYIICHGVFSWVPKEVQDKILETIKSSLTENGAAIVSYNTYPGWKTSDILRDIMLFRAEVLRKGGLKIEGADVVEYGKKAIEFLRDYSYLNKNLKDMVDNILKKDTYYLYHEYYEENNNPMYLYEFNKMLEEKGLIHISDSDISKTIPLYSNDKMDMEEILTAEVGEDKVAKEQYYDFLYNRMFRTSIVGHIENKNKLNVSKNLFKDDLRKLYIRGKFFKNDSGINYIKDGRNIDPSYDLIIEILNQNYPNNILFYDIVNDEKLVDIKEVEKKLLQLIYNSWVEISTEKIETRNDKKLSLDDRWRKYVEYHLNQENSLISFSTFEGEVISLNKALLKIMLLFNGENTDEDILDIKLNELEKGEIEVTPADGRSQKQELEKIIRELREFVVGKLLIR